MLREPIVDGQGRLSDVKLGMYFAQLFSSSNVIEFAADLIDNDVREVFEVINFSNVGDDNDVFRVS